MHKMLLRNTILGLVVGIVLCFVLPINRVEMALLFALFVTVPLTLGLTETSDRFGKWVRGYVVAVRLQFPAALAGAFALGLPQGWLAGALSLPWLLFTCVVAFYGLMRLSERGGLLLEEVALDVGLMYIALGGGWFVLYIWQVPVLSFSSLIILLTAVHFHYSAFVSPVFVGLLGRQLNVRRSVAYRLAAVGMMAGPLLIAAGITFSRVIELLAVSAFVLSLWVYAYLSLFRLRMKQRWARVALTISSVSLLITMTPALLYSLGRWLGRTFIPIPDMVSVHGYLNIFLFVMFGLLAWTLVRPPMVYNLYGIPRSRLMGKGRIGADFFERTGWVSEQGHPHGLVDDFSIYEGAHFQPHKIDPDVVAFYEHTSAYRLKSRVRWLKGFAFLSRIYKRISGRIGQLNLPAHHENVRMSGRILGIKREVDGRENVRAWIRTDDRTQETIFVAAYAHHRWRNETYMNIALPLPFGNMTGVLRPGYIRHDGRGLYGLRLTSAPRKNRQGDEGTFFHTRGFTVRLPLREDFALWRVDDAGTLKASHRMRIVGIPFLAVDYLIEKESV